MCRPVSGSVSASFCVQPVVSFFLGDVLNYVNFPAHPLDETVAELTSEQAAALQHWILFHGPIEVSVFSKWLILTLRCFVSSGVGIVATTLIHNAVANTGTVSMDLVQTHRCCLLSCAQTSCAIISPTSPMKRCRWSETFASEENDEGSFFYHRLVHWTAFF